MVCLCCNNTTNILVCSHCKGYVCSKDECQISFPYYNNQIQVICKVCVDTISKKLIPILFLKQNIKFTKQNIKHRLHTLKIKIKTKKTMIQKKKIRSY